MAALKALLMFSSQLGRFTAETCVNYNLEVTRSLCSAKSGEKEASEYSRD